MIDAETLVRTGIKVAALPGGLVTRRRPGDVTILLYHTIGVSDAEIDMPPERFRAQLAWLAEHEDVRSLDDAIADPRGGVVVTFDDGYADFAKVVVPSLVEVGIPATLYLATALVDDSGDGSERLRWSDLEEAMTTGLVTVGAHTHDHANLAQATEHEALEQMRRSKELVEDRLGSACRHFAYPWSVASPAAEAAAAQLFQTAALPVWRVNRRKDLDPLRLGRTPVLRSDIGRLFVAKTRGFLNGEALAYRVLRRGPWSWS